MIDVFGIEITGAILAGIGATLAGVGSFLSGYMAFRTGRRAEREARRLHSGGESAGGGVGLPGIDSPVPGGTGTDPNSDR